MVTRRTSVVHDAHVRTVFEHQHSGRRVHVADRWHFVFTSWLVLDRLHRPTDWVRIHRRLFAVPLGVRGLLQRLNQARPVRGFDHPQRSFAQVLIDELQIIQVYSAIR